MDRDEIIRVLGRQKMCLIVRCSKPCSECEYYDSVRTIGDAIDAAVDLLRPRVMEPEELKDIEAGDAVYLQMRSCCWPGNEAINAWVLFENILCAGHYGDEEREYLWYFRWFDRKTLPLKESEYGVEWRLWTGKPSKEQEETKWDG